MRRATTFPRFPELPAELQLLIWEFAIPEPRVISYTSRRWSEYDFRHHSSIYSLKQTLPAILHICYDSRTEALKRYKVAFATELCKPIYFDFDRDTLEFGDFDALDAFSKTNTTFNGSLMQADDIRTLAITIEPRIEPLQFALICSNFGNLEELKVREKDSYWRWGGVFIAQDYEPLRVVESEDVVRCRPLVWALDRIRRNLQARGRDRNAWRPPRVVVGTERQWQNALKENKLKDVDPDAMDVDEPMDGK
jgi:2EXR family